MIKKLTSHGNSVALVIDKAILELLKMAADTTVELTTDGRNLIISPVREAGRAKKFRSALTKVNQRHGKTLKR